MVTHVAGLMTSRLFFFWVIFLYFLHLYTTKIRLLPFLVMAAPNTRPQQRLGVM
jgi:hypothetical protein